MGTVVNVFAVIVGSVIGLLLKKGINKHTQDALYKSLGLAVIIIGLNGVISNMFTENSGVLKSSGELLLIISLTLGTLAGEFLKLEERTNRVCKKIETKFNKNNLSVGFVSASTIFVVGAMAIIGAINDGVSGDSTVLYTKSMLDFTVAVILSSTLGYGVIFSAFSVLIYQGTITIFAQYLKNYLAGDILNQICMVGYVIVMTIGLNFIFPNKFKSLNILPALLVPVIYNLIMKIF